MDETTKTMSAGLIERMLDRLTPASVFGQPLKEGEVTIIPVAAITCGFGYGSGRGRRPAEAGEQPAEVPGEDGGEGGGAGGTARPQGFIRIGPDGVSYQTTADPMMIPLAGIVMTAWSVFWITATVRAFAAAKRRRKV